LKLRLLAVAFLLCSSLCWGWNCTTPGQVRVQVPTGTVGAGTGDGSGQVVVDDGLTFECETLPNSTPSSASNSNTNTNSNSNTVNSTLSSSNVNSLKQNQTQQQQQSQSQTATGGAATSTATGGTAANNGNNSNNSTTNVEAPKIPVASAYAPTALPSAPCVKSYGGGAQTMSLGLSGGFGKIDKGCDDRETARSFALLGSRLAACKVLIQEREAKRAGVTLADCLQLPTPELKETARVVTREATPAPPVVIVENVVTPAPVVNVTTPPVVKTVVTVTAPKKKPVVHHLPPSCQNVVQPRCPQEK